MAQTTVISTKELQRQAALVFEGKTVNVMLCSVGTSGYTEESTVANWQSVELSGNGYARFSAVIQSGSYNTTQGAYIIPVINAAFTATTPYSYDRIVIYIQGETYTHSVVREDPNVILSAGQTQTYAITLRQDD